MDALRNSKKICLLAVAILLLFTFFNLILDAPRIHCRYILNYHNLSSTRVLTVPEYLSGLDM
jgi:hypothetical protein